MLLIRRLREHIINGSCFLRFPIAAQFLLSFFQSVDEIHSPIPAPQFRLGGSQLLQGGINHSVDLPRLFRPDLLFDLGLS